MPRNSCGRYVAEIEAPIGINPYVAQSFVW
jgi:hypothetical protein